MKKRIFFDKYEEMRFISHLDMLRFADRLLKKAHIPMKYTQGFHPRPRISLGNPISLGTEAFNELMDIELLEPMTNEEVLEKINSAAVPGFRVNKVETVTDKISIADIYTNAIFEIEGSKEDIDILENLFNQEEIIERKEKKGKISERNLGERVKDFSRIENKITLELVNTSPNSFLILAGI
ncbi:MAG: TIGR03936 family radical SAM-associated protein, partial [Cetobacterium sp.]